MVQDYRISGYYPKPITQGGSLYTKPTSLDLTIQGSQRKKKGYSNNLTLDKTGGGY